MTNFEWLVNEKTDLLKELLEKGNQFCVKKESGEVTSCPNISCSNCLFGKSKDCLGNGKEWLNAEHNSYSIPADTPIDTKILVRDNEEDEWSRGYFAGFENEGLYPYKCFDSGATSWSSEGAYGIWKYCKLADCEI